MNGRPNRLVTNTMAMCVLGTIAGITSFVCYQAQVDQKQTVADKVLICEIANVYELTTGQPKIVETTIVSKVPEIKDLKPEDLSAAEIALNSEKPIPVVSGYRLLDKEEELKRAIHIRMIIPKIIIQQAQEKAKERLQEPPKEPDKA